MTPAASPRNSVHLPAVFRAVRGAALASEAVDGSATTSVGAGAEPPTAKNPRAAFRGLLAAG